MLRGSDTVYRQVFTVFCCNRDAKVNNELYIDLSTATPNAPPNKIVPYQCRAKRIFYFAFSISSFTLFNSVLSSIPCSPNHHCSHIRIRTDMTNKVQFDRQVKKFRLNLLFASAWFQISGLANNDRRKISKPTYLQGSILCYN